MSLIVNCDSTLFNTGTGTGTGTGNSTIVYKLNYARPGLHLHMDYLPHIFRGTYTDTDTDTDHRSKSKSKSK